MGQLQAGQLCNMRNTLDLGDLSLSAQTSLFYTTADDAKTDLAERERLDTCSKKRKRPNGYKQ